MFSGRNTGTLQTDCGGVYTKNPILTQLDHPFSGSVASSLCCLLLFIFHSHPLYPLQDPNTYSPSVGLLFPLACPTFLPPLSPSFPSKRAYFLLLRKAKLTRSQTSPVDEGKYIILTKERQTDVFTRVCSEDVAQRLSSRGSSLGGSDWRGRGPKHGVKSDFLFVQRAGAL